MQRSRKWLKYGERKKNEFDDLESIIHHQACDSGLGNKI